MEFRKRKDAFAHLTLGCFLPGGASSSLLFPFVPVAMAEFLAAGLAVFAVAVLLGFVGIEKGDGKALLATGTGFFFDLYGVCLAILRPTTNEVPASLSVTVYADVLDAVLGVIRWIEGCYRKRPVAPVTGFLRWRWLLRTFLLPSLL